MRHWISSKALNGTPSRNNANQIVYELTSFFLGIFLGVVGMVILQFKYNVPALVAPLFYLLFNIAGTLIYLALK